MRNLLQNLVLKMKNKRSQDYTLHLIFVKNGNELNPVTMIPNQEKLKNPNHRNPTLENFPLI